MPASITVWGDMGLIDSHAHLTSPALRTQLDRVLERASQAGVEHVITIGTDLSDAQAAVDLARSHPEQLSVAIGFHPHEAAKVSASDFKTMVALWEDPLVVALGEMGLDYHYDFADRAVQREVFSRQLAEARKHDKPIIIHGREAFEDLAPMLVDHGFADRGVVFHCFTGTQAEAIRIQENGWRISFTGIVTFGKSTELQEIAKAYPADALMVETDSPYLSPVPVRGRKPNEPAHVAHIARFLAELREESYESLVSQTNRNTKTFFNLT